MKLPQKLRKSSKKNATKMLRLLKKKSMKRSPKNKSRKLLKMKRLVSRKRKLNKTQNLKKIALKSRKDQEVVITIGEEIREAAEKTEEEVVEAISEAETEDPHSMKMVLRNQETLLKSNRSEDLIEAEVTVVTVVITEVETVLKQKAETIHTQKAKIPVDNNLKEDAAEEDAPKIDPKKERTSQNRLKLKTVE